MFLAAIFCGFLLDYERQSRGKPVGILTGILVSLASTLFVQAGALISQGLALDENPTRLRSMIVSGIGFIGAGAILRSKFNVAGLTSAATIWGLGGLGILIGCSYPITGVLLAVVVVVLLTVVAGLERGYEKFIGPRPPTRGSNRYRADH